MGDEMLFAQSLFTGRQGVWLEEPGILEYKLSHKSAWSARVSTSVISSMVVSFMKQHDESYFLFKYITCQKFWVCVCVIQFKQMMENSDKNQHLPFIGFDLFNYLQRKVFVLGWKPRQLSDWELSSKAGGELTTEQLGGMNTNCSIILPEPEPEVKEEEKKEETEEEAAGDGEEEEEEEEGDEEEEEEDGEEEEEGDGEDGEGEEEGEGEGDQNANIDADEQNE